MARKNLDLRTSRAGSRYDDSSDPMSTVGNIADVMLVFACGLMMALVTYWNVDISSVKEVLKQDQIAEVESPEELSEELTTSDGTSYIDMGSVYMNPATGKYYMLTENAEAVEDASSSSPTSQAPAASSSSSADASSSADTSTGSSTSNADAITERSMGAD